MDNIFGSFKFNTFTIVMIVVVVIGYFVLSGMRKRRK